MYPAKDYPDDPHILGGITQGQEVAVDDIDRYFQNEEHYLSQGAAHRNYIVNRAQEILESLPDGQNFGIGFLRDETRLFAEFMTTLPNMERRREEINAAAYDIFPSPTAIDQFEGEKRKKLARLFDSFEKIRHDAISSYIQGNYFAATTSITALLESVLKFEIERRDIEFECTLTLRNCIRVLEDAEVFQTKFDDHLVEDLKELKNIRNDIVHLNTERNTPRSNFVASEGVHETKRTRSNDWEDIPERAILEFGDRSRRTPSGDIEVDYRYRKAAFHTIKETTEVLKRMYASNALYW